MCKRMRVVKKDLQLGYVRQNCWFWCLALALTFFSAGTPHRTLLWKLMKLPRLSIRLERGHPSQYWWLLTTWEMVDDMQWYFEAARFEVHGPTAWVGSTIAGTDRSGHHVWNNGGFTWTRRLSKFVHYTMLPWKTLETITWSYTSHKSFPTLSHLQQHMNTMPESQLNPACSLVFLAKRGRLIRHWSVFERAIEVLIFIDWLIDWFIHSFIHSFINSNLIVFVLTVGL